MGNLTLPCTVSQELYQPKRGCARDFSAHIFLCQPYTLKYEVIKINERASWCFLAQYLVVENSLSHSLSLELYQPKRGCIRDTFFLPVSSYVSLIH